MGIIYSYIPFLENPGLIEHDDTSECQSVINSHPDGVSQYCLWIPSDRSPTALFVYQRARDMYDHLMRFCCNDPAKYFRLEFKMTTYGYALGLVPNLKASIDSTILLRSIMGRPILDDKIHVVYSPLLFFHNRVDYVKTVGIRNRLNFGIVDEDNMEEGMKNPLIIGEFELSNDIILVDSVLQAMQKSNSVS